MKNLLFQVKTLDIDLKKALFLFNFFLNIWFFALLNLKY